MTMDTYTYTCRCGKQSPRFNSRELSRDWHAGHVRDECAARRAKPRQGLDWGDFDELLAHAQRMKPVDPSLNSTSTGANGWRDASVVDKWDGAAAAERYGPTGTV